MRQQARHNSFVATYRELQRNSKTNVLSDMHVLLSAAKNSTALRNSKTNVLPDMLSGCIEYQDLRSEKHTYKLAIGSKRIEKSLYLIPADCKSAGTIVLLVYAACRKQQSYCSVGYAIRQHKVSGSVIRKTYL